MPGLSPRVRGNHVRWCFWCNSAGSIPARAGQPHPRPSRRTWTAVYPRACGATVRLGGAVAERGGLSPRVRGNRATVTVTSRSKRSIPARAGQPGPGRFHRHKHTVYPRACGATEQLDDVNEQWQGLSPRVRGNRRLPGRRHPLHGSIPARAGQPNPAPEPMPTSTVYPRACGATPTPRLRRTLLNGLSPRVRGNPRRERGLEPIPRSIPARAGQPGYVGEQHG